MFFSVRWGVNNYIANNNIDGMPIWYRQINVETKL